MFTGIIEGQGRIEAAEELGDVVRMRIATELADGAPEGASIAVDGVCLTVTDEGGASGGVFTVDVIGETLRRTTLGLAAVGSPVNIERGMPAGGRLDGHIVAGHVDATGEVTQITDEGGWTTLRVVIPSDRAAEIVEKGSITLNGVSLTITGVSKPDTDLTWLSVGLIPETLAITNLGTLNVGSRVNIETDIIGKYVARITAVHAADTARVQRDSKENK